MESVFEELLAEGTSDNGQNEGDFDHSFDLGAEDFADDTAEELQTTADNPADEGVDEGDGTELVPTNRAFAQMRTENKQYSEKISEIDAIAKSLGMQNVDEFIAKAKSAQIQREAKAKGIPTEVAQELAEMRSLKDSIVAEREAAERENIERNFASNVDSFIKSNKLSDSAVDKLSQDLEKDGLDVNYLMSMPKAALNRILSSYVDTSYQKNLERKDTIRKELPINQSSKIDTVSLNKEIDALAKSLAGK